MRTPSLAARLAVPAALLLVACSHQADDQTAIGADDQRQLNDAATMLDANGAAALPDHESSPHD